MKKLFYTTAAVCITMLSATAQDSAKAKQADTSITNLTSPAANTAKDGSVYNIKPKIDIPVTAVLTGWTLYGFSQAYGKPTTTQERINSLDRNDIPRFDRWATKIYSEDAAKTSDLFFYGSMPVPFLLMFDKHMRKDAAKIGLLYLEAMSITGTLYTGATTFVDRFRPYVYNNKSTEGDQRDGNAKNSFFAGHVALVGTATFFTAKVYADYHPGSKWNKWIYTGAGLATASTAYLRHRGGRHFPSDIVLGTAVGVLSGVLVPHWHKNKLFKNEQMSLTPFTGLSHGLAFQYRFK